VGLPWWSLTAFVRIATNARAFPEPLSSQEAALQVEEWLDAPRAWLAEPSRQFRDVFGGLLRSHDVRGPLVTDVQLAALAIDHGVPVASTDGDFARFREVEWINPLDL
jgi:toxin-antitoxin system PIN domain toxin